jgi:hypothetical protein
MPPAWNEAHFKCGQCGRHLSQQGHTVEEVVLPPPWRRFTIEGWVGTFVACSNRCEEGLRVRHPIP